MALNLKLPKFLTGSKNPSDQTVSADTVMDAAQPVSKKAAGFSLAVMSQYSVGKQLQIYGGALALVIVLAIGIVAHVNQEATYSSAYIATAGEMQMLSQRLAKASSLALQGNMDAFSQLRDSHRRFSEDVKALTDGGTLANTIVPPSPDSTRADLQGLSTLWSETEKDTVQMMDMENYLVGLNKDVLSIIEYNPRMLDLTEQVVAIKLRSGASVREITAASQLVMLTQRIAKSANELQNSSETGPELAFQLGKDARTFQDLQKALAEGSEVLRIAAASDEETKALLKTIAVGFKEYQGAINGILSSMERLVVAKLAGAKIFLDSEALLEATDKLTQAYQRDNAEKTWYIVTLIVLIVLAFAALGMMAKVYLDDKRHQAQLADESRQASELINRQNQDAILRLMNELGDLADGDLTVTATVSEDITGAIADSINYTIEELRVLVGRINDAAGRVTTATGIAQHTSDELLDATRRQSVEIQDAGHSVLTMAGSMSKVSGDADESAQVALRSLAAAGKGAQAVQDSIKGMNEIREQIQETSKRIKRLGESSQEIGEIVELISDITEQTNVLALNAAIQAASAGDAGRGFTVVAEEVQRLAERSGEATKQIAAIVKTIQTDTHGAVSAMEESTRGVVEGAKLSDAAGQALAEIGEVSQNLAELIDNISQATREQAESATSVADKMQDILRITEQTTIGTQKTASAVGELAGLATELKGSVAGFKVG